MNIYNKILSGFNSETPGYALLIQKNEKTVFEKYVGLSNLFKKTPISKDTAFRLASLSKQFTAMAIMLLYEDQKLGFDNKLSDFFPNLPSWSKSITIRNLLNHTSGIPDHEKPLYGIYKNTRAGAEPNIYSALSVLENVPTPLFEAGREYAYSESGYVILALIIEKLTDISYREYLSKNIFRPLGMSSSIVFDQTKPKIKNRALGYRKNGDGFKLYDYDLLNYIVGNEGVYSSTSGLIKWTNAWTSEKLVTLETLKKATTPYCLPDKSLGRYGFGWFIEKIDGAKTIYHTGSWVGFNNIILIIPAKKMTIIFLSNTNLFPDPEKRFSMALDLARIYQ